MNEFLNKRNYDFNLDDLGAVQSLINRGVQLNGEYLGKDAKPDQYPLHHAIGRERIEGTIKSIWHMNHLYYVDLFTLFQLDFNEEILKLLIKSGADLETRNYYNYTPL